MGRYGEIWGDLGRYGEMEGSMRTEQRYCVAGWSPERLKVCTGGLAAESASRLLLAGVCGR